MAEYIEREAAIEAIIAEPPDAHYPQWYANKIKFIPSADVAPVRHGRWIIDSAGGKIACSDCGCIYLGYNGRLTPNYCPNCGAKMDLSDECEQEVER